MFFYFLTVNGLFHLTSVPRGWRVANSLLQFTGYLALFFGFYWNSSKNLVKNPGSPIEFLHLGLDIEIYKFIFIGIPLGFTKHYWISSQEKIISQDFLKLWLVNLPKTAGIPLSVSKYSALEIRYKLLNVPWKSIRPTEFS